MEKEKFLKEKINSYLKYFNYDFTPVEFQNIFQKTLSDLNTFLAKDPSNGGDFIIIIKYNEKATLFCTKFIKCFC